MRVRHGRVQKKNNWVPDHKDYYARPQHEIQIERGDPGAGYRHVVSVAQLREFLAMLPDWDELAVGLEAISIWHGAEQWWGLSRPGVVVITAWPRELWTVATASWVREIADLLELMNVAIAAQVNSSEADGPGIEICGRVVHSENIELRWTEAQARGFMLLDVLVHELGHHHDRMTSHGPAAARGEPYAHAYARRVRNEIWAEYAQRFAT